MSALSVLRCDQEGCDRKYIKAYSTPYLRQAAECEGWRSDDIVGDLCPWHVPAVEVEDELDAAA